jgi:IclR family acetate operon transcriptional repressor
MKDRTAPVVGAGSHIQSVARALDLLEALGQEELGLAELGRRTGLQPSTTHRMLATLTARGYVQRAPSGRYSLGDRTASLGGALSTRERELMIAVRPLMQRIHAVTRQAVHLSVLQGAEVVFVYQMLDRTHLNALAHDNVRVPAHVSASGKALMANHDSGGRPDASIPVLKPFTRRSIVERKDLWREFEGIRARGFAVDRREYRPDMCCVAAPLFDATGHAVAALSVSGPSNLVREELSDDFGELVAGSASEASAALGYAGASHWGGLGQRPV